MTWVPGIGNLAVPVSSLNSAGSGGQGLQGPQGDPGPAGTNGANGFIVLGTGTLGSAGDGFTVSLSENLTENKSVLIVADIEIATTANPDFYLYPNGATLTSFTYRFWAGASAASGTNPRIARVAGSGVSGMRVQAAGVLTMTENGNLSYVGQHSNSTLAQYGQSAFYGPGSSPVSMLNLFSSVANAMAAGSKLTVFKLW